MRQKYLSSWNLINIERKVWRYNRKLQANGQKIDTWTKCEEGVQSIGNRSSLERWLVTWYEAKCKNISESMIYRRVRFRSCGTVGYGPTMWVKSRGSSDILHGHDSKACQRVACQLCRSTTSVPRARDEENHFPARWTRRAIRQSSCPSVATGMSSTSNRVLLTWLFTKVFT